MSAEQPSWDLTQQLIPYLDRQLVLPLLDFLDEKGEYNHDDILQAKIDLLTPTNMVKYVETLHEERHPGDQAQKQDFQKRQDGVLQQLKELSAEAQTVMDIISNPEVFQSLKQDKTQNLQFLKDVHGLTLEKIEILYRFGRFQYSIGSYAEASDYFFHFRVLTTDSTMEASAMWGKLVADILEGSFDAALTELELVKRFIDTHYPADYRDSAAGLQQRTWYLHWSLFVFFNHAEGREKLVESWMSQTAVGGSQTNASQQQQQHVQLYLQALQTNAPHLLRYLVAAVVISSRAVFKGATHLGTYSRIVSREHMGQAILTTIKQEKYQYYDPITEFLRSLFIDVDFEEAAKRLKEAEAVCEQDFFLSSCKDEFVERARWLFSETFCRVHHRIDIGDLSSRLGLSSDEGEKWIVNLIRDARMDAKIDFKNNLVQMNRQHATAHQAVIERTKTILEHTTRLANSIDVGTGMQQDGKTSSGRGGNKSGGGSGRSNANASNNSARIQQQPVEATS